MSKVYVTREIYPEALEILRRGLEVEVWDEDRAIPRDVLLRKVGDADGEAGGREPGAAGRAGGAGRGEVDRAAAGSRERRRDGGKDGSRHEVPAAQRRIGRRVRIQRQRA